MFLLTLILSALSAPYNLGSLQFHSGVPSAPLLQKMIPPGVGDPGSLGVYSFVGKVGGVAFAGVAKPEETFSPTNIVIDDPSRPDGSRLMVHFDGNAVTAMVPDWMLIPIAGYADSEFNACVSLFGPETTDAQYDIIYHPAFQNTLLGLRLLQADILLFDLRNTWNLPSVDGETPLGLGERQPTSFNQEAAIAVQDAMNGGQFQSWVFTDGDAQTLFAVRAGELRFVGDPYYHFWIGDLAGYERQHNALITQANDARANVEQYNAIVGRANALEPKVSPVQDRIDGLRGKSNALSEFNPAVYNAARNTMHFSAFFRYVKAQNPSTWTAFLEKIRAVPLRPAIETPSKWPK